MPETPTAAVAPQKLTGQEKRTQVVTFTLRRQSFNRDLPFPVASVNQPIVVVLKGDGWDRANAYNFRPVAVWPPQEVPWKTDEGTKATTPDQLEFHFDGAKEPEKELVLPPDMRNLIKEACQQTGEDSYAILKFEVEAWRVGDSKRYYVDPGIGVLP